jgi:hypothetical protein
MKQAEQSAVIRIAFRSNIVPDPDDRDGIVPADTDKVIDSFDERIESWHISAVPRHARKVLHIYIQCQIFSDLIEPIHLNLPLQDFAAPWKLYPVTRSTRLPSSAQPADAYAVPADFRFSILATGFLKEQGVTQQHFPHTSASPRDSYILAFSRSTR